MVYLNKFVAAVKVNGQVLRESGNAVLVPFGSEYSILLKNLNSVRALARVSIDGQEATNSWLIVPANGSIELERYIRDGNMESGNRFKFIERTSDIEKHRGVKAEDGLVRIEFKTEQAVQEVPRIRYYDKWVPVERPYTPWPYWYLGYPYYGEVTFTSTTGLQGGGCSGLSNASGGFQGAQNRSVQATNCSASLEQERSGITVAGSQSDQKFTTGEWFPTESQSQVIVLQLRGVAAGKKVKKAVTVKQKPKCSTCGKASKAGAEFCGKCGTVLVVI